MSEHERYVTTMTSHGFHEYIHLFESLTDVKLFRRTAKLWTLGDVTCGSSSDVQKKTKKLELALIVVSHLHEEYKAFREVVLTLIMNYRSTGFAVPFIRRQFSLSPCHHCRLRERYLLFRRSSTTDKMMR